jgi:hypothetical protein
LKNLNQLTDDDLSKAISLATTMKDTQAVTCFQFILRELPNMRGDVAAVTTESGGLVTRFEAGHVWWGGQRMARRTRPLSKHPADLMY